MHRLRALRLEKGLTLEEVAKVVGISHSQLSRIETGKAPLSQHLAKLLAPVIGGKAADLMVDRLVPVVGLVGRDGSIRRLRPGENCQGAPAISPPGDIDVPLLALRVAVTSNIRMAAGSVLFYAKQKWCAPTDVSGFVIAQSETGFECICFCRRGIIESVTITPATNGHATATALVGEFERVTPILALLHPLLVRPSDD